MIFWKCGRDYTCKNTKKHFSNLIYLCYRLIIYFNMTSFKRFESKPVVKIILIYDRLNLWRHRQFITVFYQFLHIRIEIIHGSHMYILFLPRVGLYVILEWNFKVYVIHIHIDLNRTLMLALYNTISGSALMASSLTKALSKLADSDEDMELSVSYMENSK